MMNLFTNLYRKTPKLITHIQRFLCALLLFLQLMFNPVIQAQTIVEAGNVSGIWTSAGSPYLVNGNIIVPESMHLDIESGVVVEFQGLYYLDVRGTLDARGVEGDSVYFRPDDPDRGWYGIRLTGSWQDTTVLDHCIIERFQSPPSYPEYIYTALSLHDSVHAIITHCRFINNRDGGNGGAIYCNNATAEINHSLFSGNSSNSGGGAVSSNYSRVEILHNSFLGNSSAKGGAVYSNMDTSVIISGNRFFHNFATDAGGAIALSYGSYARINSNTLSYNEALQHGGAIYLTGYDSISILNNLISHNISTQGSASSCGGGGIWVRMTNAAIVNNTITDNSSFGIYGHSSNLWLVNNILSGNTSKYGLDVNFHLDDYDEPEPNVYFSNCLVDGGEATFDYSSWKFVQSYTDCIDTLPRFVDREFNNYELDFGSKAIDTGRDTLGLQIPQTDLNGNPRILGSQIDMGTYEFDQTVRNRVPRIVEIPDYYINPGDTLRLTILFEDPDSLDTHIIELGSDNTGYTTAGLSGDTSGSSFELIPYFLENDTTRISVRVTDSSLSENDTDSISFTVIRGRNIHLDSYPTDKDMVWMSDTMRIYTDLIIERDRNLAIAPGTYIEFQDNYLFQVFGQVLAEGVTGDSITFTKNPELEFDYWQGIKYYYDFHQSNYPPDEISRFSHCIIECAQHGFYLQHLRDIRIMHCDIRRNNQGIYCDGGVTVEDCRIHNNHCDSRGGGLCVDGYGSYECVARIYNNLIHDNTTTASGGGIHLFGSHVLIVGNRIFDNSADLGGGIATGQNNDIFNNTIAGNSARIGGGIWLNETTFGSVIIQIINNIIQFNEASDWGGQLAVEENGENTILRNCYLQGGTSGIVESGRTFTGQTINLLSENSSFADTAIHDYSLVPSSICINAGILDFPYMDKWNQGILDHLTIHDGAIDIGAVEFTGIPDNRLPILDRSPEIYIRTDSSTWIRIAYRELDINDTTEVEIDYDNDLISIDSAVVSDETVELLITPKEEVDNETEIIIRLLDRSQEVQFQNSDTLDLQITNTHVVCGEIETNTFWNADVVLVDCDVTVSKNTILTIAPGTKVLFNENTGMTIEGVIQAIGTIDRPIEFGPQKSTWTGLSVALWDDYSVLQGDTSSFTHCIVKNTNSLGLTILRSEMIVSASSFSNHSNGAISIVGSISPIFRNNHIYNNQNYAIRADGFPLIEGNLIEDNYSQYLGIIYSIQGEPMIYRNLIRNNHGNAIQFKYYGYPVGFRIVNNEITGSRPYNGENGSAIDCYGNRRGLYSGVIAGNVIADNQSDLEGAGIHVAYTDFPRIYIFNNTIVQNSSSDENGGGIYLGRSAYADLYNNILWDNSARGVSNQVYVAYMTRGGKVANCVIQGGSEGITGPEKYLAGLDVENTIIDDPLLVEPLKGDFRIKRQSPCVNAGALPDSAHYLPETDLYGTQRILNDTLDIGAFEFICHDDSSDLFYSICEGDSVTMEGQVFSHTGDYTIYTHTILGCDSTIRLSLNNIPGPKIDLGNDTTIYAGDTIRLDAGPGFASYTWSDNTFNRYLLLEKAEPGEYNIMVTVTNEASCSRSDTIIINVEDRPSFVNMAHPSIRIEVYPNPTSSMLYLELNSIKGDVTLQLVSSDGQTCFQKQINRADLIQILELDLSSFPGGMYFLKLLTKDGLVSGKVIVE